MNQKSPFRVGTIRDYLNRKTAIILFFQFLLIISFLGYRSWKDSIAECIVCHSNKEKLQSLGYPEFYVTQEMVERESNHPNVKCHECHLGDGRAKESDKAHKGMLKVLLIDKRGNILRRKDVYPHALLPSGNDKLREMLPEREVMNILWHDRDPETLSFNPEIAKKTCGKSGCHPQELDQFRKTTMARNFRQRTMKTWLKPYGPHNCGPSFADLPLMEVLKESGFSFKNTEEIIRELNTDFTKEQAMVKQKFCNMCHAGCLDCHYSPIREKGVHAFSKKPTAETCSGGGRGSNICHTGALERRRGETYVGGDYSEPPGMEPDVHYKKNIHCSDCHQTGEKGMGDMQRKATCQDCHLEIEEAHAKSIHKNLDCATCHIQELRGYQLTIWGRGVIADKPNPFKKYSLYYGTQKPPILMKDQKGIWMPVKVWPHSLGNFKKDVKPSEKILFRWPEGETRDAYYIVGTFDNLPNNNKHLLWLEIEQAAHPFGKARICDSCHKNERQVSVSTWEFFDNQGAEPFNGTHKIITDKDGIRITDIKNTTPIRLVGNSRLEDFASWVFLKDEWKAPGDFSIKTDKEEYRKSLGLSNEIEKELKRLDALSRVFDKKRLRQYRDLKGVVLHKEEDAKKLINDFKLKNLIK